MSLEAEGRRSSVSGGPEAQSKDLPAFLDQAQQARVSTSELDQGSPAPVSHVRRPPWVRAVAHFMRRPEAGALIGALSVYVFFAIFAHANGFMSLTATAGWLNSAAELGIVVVPVAMLMIAGEFDLSVGSTVACSSMTVAVATAELGFSLPSAIAIAIGFALIIGLVNGYATVLTKLPSFIVTLATYLIIAGLTLTLARSIAGSAMLSIPHQGGIETVFAGSLFDFQISILWWLVLASVAAYVLARLPFGNWIYATGGDLQVARESGVPTDRVKVVLFVLTSLGAAFVGVIQVVEYHSASIDQGQSFVFNSIIASVIGGVLLGGGYGSVFGAILGTTTYGIVHTGVFYTGWPSDLVRAILGSLLFAAVAANHSFRRSAQRS